MQSNSLYPLKFKTIFKEKIWGGNKIKSILNKDFSSLENCGETWEISGVENNESIVDGGSLTGKTLLELVKSYQDDLLGKGVYQNVGNNFPLLIKFIDANTDLSIQVHPNDQLALERHNSLGKTEMWYIIQADTDASIITGFSKQTNKKEYLNCLNNGKLHSLLNTEKVKSTEVYNIPAGRVHTIGKGCFLAEIQQTSDITYRIFDYDRIDKEGNKRELHTSLALDALDYDHYDNYKTSYNQEVKNEKVSLITNKYFHTSKFVLENIIKISEDNSSFTILIGVNDHTIIEYASDKYDLNFGDVILIPATINNYTISPVNSKSEILHVRLK